MGIWYPVVACHELSKNTQYVYIEYNLPSPFFDWNFGWNRPFSNSKKPKFVQQKSQKNLKWHKIVKNGHSIKIKTAMECLKCALSGFDLIISNYFHLGGVF